MFWELVPHTLNGVIGVVLGITYHGHHGACKSSQIWKSSTSQLSGDHSPRPFIPRQSGYIHALLVIRRNIDYNDVRHPLLYFYSSTNKGGFTLRSKVDEKPTSIGSYWFKNNILNWMCSHTGVHVRGMKSWSGANVPPLSHRESWWSWLEEILLLSFRTSLQALVQTWVWK